MNFNLTVSQKEKFEKWEKHCEIYAGAIGGRISFEFTPTGLGDIVKAKCLCGKEIDLTESEDW